MGIKELNFRTEIARLNPVARRIVTVALLGLLLASLACLVEDYTTSYYGLALVPGKLANDWIRFLLAATPSLLQVVFAFVAISQRNRLAAGITLAAWTFDFGTDLAYKLQGVPPGPGNIALVMVYSFFIVSFFSEFMLMFSLQHLAFALGPAWAGLRARWAQAKAEAEKARSNGAGRQQGLFDDMQDLAFPPEAVEDGYQFAAGRRR